MTQAGPLLYLPNPIDHGRPSSFTVFLSFRIQLFQSDQIAIHWNHSGHLFFKHLTKPISIEKDRNLSPLRLQNPPWRKNPKGGDHISRRCPRPPPSPALVREGSVDLPGTLPERGIDAGGIYITMPASGVMLAVARWLSLLLVLNCLDLVSCLSWSRSSICNCYMIVFAWIRWIVEVIFLFIYVLYFIYDLACSPMLVDALAK